MSGPTGGGSGGCEKRIEFTVNFEKIGGGGGWLSGGSDPRIEAIVKVKSRRSDWVGVDWMFIIHW